MTDKFISPTVRWRYSMQPGWTTSEGARKAMDFGTSRDRDIKGFDLEGFDEKGFDRAGYSAEDYSRSPATAELVHANGHLICKTASAPLTFRKGLQATSQVLSALSRAWPDLPVFDLDDDMSDDEHPTWIERGIDGVSGVLAVTLRHEPAEVTDSGRSLRFECGLAAAMEAQNPLGSFNFTVYSSDIRDSWNVMHFRDLVTRGDIVDMVGEASGQFHPFDDRYAVCVVDHDGKGIIRAFRVDEDETLESIRGLGLPGDPVALHYGRDEISTLANLIESAKLRSHAMVGMARKGLEVANGGVPMATYGY